MGPGFDYVSDFTLLFSKPESDYYHLYPGWQVYIIKTYKKYYGFIKMDDFLNTRQVEDLLRVDRVTIYHMLQDGRLKGNKIGSQWRFQRADIERLLRGEKPEPPILRAAENFPTPAACLVAIQHLFSEVSHLSTMLLSMDGELITPISGPNPVCQLILSSPSGWDACLESWRGFTEQSKEGIKRFTCHAGFNYLGKLVTVRGIQKALFVIGPFYWQPPEPDEETLRIRRLSDYHQLSYQDLVEAVQTVSIIPTAQHAQLESWLTAVVEAVQSIYQERSVYVERLQQIASLTQVL
jgi:excisionase family DNA binding protein